VSTISSPAGRKLPAQSGDYRRQLNIDIKVVRIFNTYGPRMQPDDGRVVSSFIVQALRGDEITIFGDGNQTRSFCHVDDLVGGIVAMMNTPAGITGPVNLGNPSEFSVRQLAEPVKELTGSASRTVSKAPIEDDPRQRRPDIEAARRLLGWKPTIGLEQGLRRTIEYFDALLSGRGC
jgi:UDP-glucuronate decarboxylase